MNEIDMMIRQITGQDPEVVAAAFAALGWTGKTVSQYEGYLDEQRRGMREVLVAEVGGRFAGYVTVVWRSSYEAFEGIPEISDFNVLPDFRRQGIGSALMDAAEALVAQRSPVVGIGVGLYAAYGSAQRMYVRRGYVPDGRGVVRNGRAVTPGSSVPIDDDVALMFTKSLKG